MTRSGGEPAILLVVVAAMALACSTTAQNGGSGGALGGPTGGASGGDANINVELLPGSCTPGVANPDSVPGGACAADCQSVSCGKSCTVDCCTTCGPNGEGQKICSCPNPGSSYANCSCVMPGDAGVSNPGPCSPQGYSTITVPAGAPAGSISLRGVACSKVTVICHTADSTPASSRTCICLADGVLHCGATTIQWPNSGVATPYN